MLSSLTVLKEIPSPINFMFNHFANCPLGAIAFFQLHRVDHNLCYFKFFAGTAPTFPCLPASASYQHQHTFLVFEYPSILRSSLPRRYSCTLGIGSQKFSCNSAFV